MTARIEVPGKEHALFMVSSRKDQRANLNSITTHHLSSRIHSTCSRHRATASYQLNGLFDTKQDGTSLCSKREHAEVVLWAKEVQIDPHGVFTTLWVYKVVAGRPHPSLQRLYTSNCWKHYQQKYKFSMREFVVILHTLQILPFPTPNAMCLGLPKLGYSKTKEKRKGTDFSKVCLTVPFRRHYRVPGTYPAGVMNTKGGEMELWGNCESLFAEANFLLKDNLREFPSWGSG